MVGEEERQASDEIKRPTQESKSKTGNTNPTEFLACLDKKFSIYIFYCHREVAHNAISKTAGRDDIILFYNFFFLGCSQSEISQYRRNLIRRLQARSEVTSPK